MFRHLADYLSHKQNKSCRRYLDSIVRTSPVRPASDSDCQTSGDREHVDLANVVRQSLQASLGEDEPLIDDDCSVPPASVSDEDTAVASDQTTSNGIVALSSEISHDVADNAVSNDQLQEVSEASQSQDQNAVADGLPEAPPPHHCPQCDFTSKFRDDFDQHLRRQHGLSSHVCIDCSRAFTDVYKLRRHQRLHCTKTPVRRKQNALLAGHVQQRVPRFVALDKRKKTSEEGVNTNETLFRCRICSEAFNDYEGIRRHVASVHSAIARPGICRFCGAWFANPYKLRRHVTSSVHDDVKSDVIASFKRQIDRMSISCTPEALRLLRRARIEQRQQQIAAAGNGNECAVCKQTFSARSALLRHTKVIHGRRSAADAAPTISCQLCGASFDRRRAYLRHRRDEHRKLPVVRAPPASRKCPVCNKLFTRADTAAKHHATMHIARQQLPDDILDLFDTGSELNSTTTSKCFVCAEPTPSRANSVRHLELMHRVWVPLPDGPVPSGLFDDMPSIPSSMQHIDDALAATQTQHLATSSSNECDESQEQIVPDMTSRSKCRGDVQSQWTCPYCKQATFSTLDALYRHKVDYHRLDAVFRCVLPSCRALFRVLSDYEVHVASSGHSQAAFICSHCNEHFVDLLSLLSHRGSAHCRRARLRHSVTPTTSTKQSGSILCDQCGQTFSKRSALMRHRAVVHKRDSSRRYACSQCDRRFVKREHLQRHVISRHGTARPYVCRAAGCGRAFKRKDKLQEHYRCHSTDRLYACSVCGRTYRQRDGLRHHERTHQRPAADHPERRRTCRRCPATFTRADKLAEHLRTVHGRGASKDIYAHRCDVCGKTFPRPERVRRHAEREHNVAADWSHRCAVCGKGFAGLRSYDVHMARHHVEGGAGRVDGARTTTKHSRRRTKVKTTTTETSPRVVVVSGRHQSSVTASCDVTRVAAAVDRQTETHCFNRFFVPSTPSLRHHQQFEQTPHHRSSRRVNAETTTTTLDRLNCGLSQCPQSDRLHEPTADNLGAHRRLSFEPLPYLHHPTKTNNEYYSGYHRHPAAPHRTQFGFYPSAPPTGFSSHSAAACAATPRGCSLFSADRTAALPFGVQPADSCFAGQSVERRPTELGNSLATAFPSVMTGDYGGVSSSSTATPLRPLATQPPAPAANAYCPVPDPPSVGRWFDSVPTLLPPPVDAANLDSVRWPPRHCIDSLTVRPRYAFTMDPTSRSNHQQSSSDTTPSVAGPSWSSVERSCLLNCSRIESAGAGLMLGSRRRGMDADRAGVVDTASLYGATAAASRDAGNSVPPHGMLSLLPPW